jgi:hypothetical protein
LCKKILFVIQEKKFIVAYGCWNRANTLLFCKNFKRIFGFNVGAKVIDEGIIVNF